MAADQVTDLSGPSGARLASASYAGGAAAADASQYAFGASGDIVDAATVSRANGLSASANGASSSAATTQAESMLTQWGIPPILAHALAPLLAPFVQLAQAFGGSAAGDIGGTGTTQKKLSPADQQQADSKVREAGDWAKAAGDIAKAAHAAADAAEQSATAAEKAGAPNAGQLRSQANAAKVYAQMADEAAKRATDAATAAKTAAGKGDLSGAVDAATRAQSEFGNAQRALQNAQSPDNVKVDGPAPGPAPVPRPAPIPGPGPGPAPIPAPVPIPRPVPGPGPAPAPNPDGSGRVFARRYDNPELQKWAGAIADASYISGLSQEQIAAQIWAESRGKADTVTTNGDGTKDIGLMQLGRERWLRDDCPKLTAQERARIQEVFGKPPEELDPSNPAEWLAAAACHSEIWARTAGSVEGGLSGYVSGNPGDTNNIYVRRVLHNEQLLVGNKPLSMTDDIAS